MSDNRCHLEEKYTWDLTTIFATDADWENLWLWKLKN